MMLQCATCSNVTVWTRVCMASMTQLPHVAVKLTDQGQKAREQLHTAGQQPRPGTASISTWLTYTLEWHTHCRVLAAEDYHQLSLSYSTDSTGHDISSSVTGFFTERLFSVCSLLTVCIHNKMDKSLVMGSLAQSELRWTTGSAVEWLDCRL